MMTVIWMTAMKPKIRLLMTVRVMTMVMMMVITKMTMNITSFPVGSTTSVPAGHHNVSTTLFFESALVTHHQLLC